MKNAQRGMTLIELMVSLLIGMILTIAVFLVLSTGEGFKRSTTSVNDVNQGGNFALFTLDQIVRSAGSGLTHAAEYVYGCGLYASRNSTQILPLPSAASMPAPFDTAIASSMNATGAFRVAPVLIVQGGTTPTLSGQASDALIVMAGNSGYGETPTPVSGFFNAASSAFPMPNVTSYQVGNLVLVANAQATGQCMVQTVSGAASSTTPRSLTLSGPATIGSAKLDNIDDQAGRILNLGPAPVFSVIGVGGNNTLMAYDLLQTGGATTPVPLADSVFEMHALYGVDTDGDGVVDTWVNPNAALSTWTASALTDGTGTAAAKLISIKAIRIGLLLRTSLLEKHSDCAKKSDGNCQSKLSLFTDLTGMQFDRTLSADEQNYRYRTVEATIPLRNPMTLQ